MGAARGMGGGGGGGGGGGNDGGKRKPKAGELTAKQEKEIADAFALFDTDGSGDIDATELNVRGVVGVDVRGCVDVRARARRVAPCHCRT